MAAKAALRAASGADCMVVAAARARLGVGGWGGRCHSVSMHDTRGGRRLCVHAPKPLLRLHTQASMKGKGSAVLAGLGKEAHHPGGRRHSVQSPTHGNSQHQRPRTQKWWPYSLRKLKECTIRSLHNEMNERRHQPEGNMRSATRRKKDQANHASPCCAQQQIRGANSQRHGSAFERWKWFVGRIVATRVPCWHNCTRLSVGPCPCVSRCVGPCLFMPLVVQNNLL